MHEVMGSISSITKTKTKTKTETYSSLLATQSQHHQYHCFPPPHLVPLELLEGWQHAWSMHEAVSSSDHNAFLGTLPSRLAQGAPWGVTLFRKMHMVVDFFFSVIDLLVSTWCTVNIPLIKTFHHPFVRSGLCSQSFWRAMRGLQMLLLNTLLWSFW